MKKTLGIVMLLLTLIFVSCTYNEHSSIPKRIKNLISEKEEKCLKCVYKYYYQNKDVYVFEFSCGDIPVVVYDEKGNMLCVPYGGVTGKGDGECSCFFDDAIKMEEIWRK